MNLKKIITIFLVTFLSLILLSSCKKNSEKDSVMITKILTEKARYKPNEKIKFEVLVDSKIDKPKKVDYFFQVYHLENEITKLRGGWQLYKENEKFVINWSAPKDDFKGYTIKLTLFDATTGNKINQATSAVDVSSNWTKFPRYGYLTNFSSGTNTQQVIEEMNEWHLNSIEYYDWKFLHHQPIPPDGSMKWEDWSGRKIDGNIIRSYIEEAKKRNIVNMSYNMIYGATNNYSEYGIKDEWRLYYAEDHGEDGKHPGDPFTFHMGDSPSGQSDLFFFDIENKDWQNYIVQKNIEALQVMGFDGWHGDTVGEWGKMWNHSEIDSNRPGKYVKDGYTKFLNEVKSKLGDYYLSFNPVGAQGLDKVSKANVDVLYAEIWPWDLNSLGKKFDSYNSIKQEIDAARKDSNGKSLIVPAYMEYEYARKIGRGEFNQSAVLLTDAAVYAAGGSRMELGDGTRMLSNEYFPAHNLSMNKEHQKRQKDWQNFIVAYENLLRDGLEDSSKEITVDKYKVSRFGLPESIWAYSKENDNYETVQLINLLGVAKNDWRADEGDKETPEKLSHFELTLYTDSEIESAWVTSPDPDYLGLSKQLKMKKGIHDGKNFIKVSIPSLEYWDMVYLKKK